MDAAENFERIAKDSLEKIKAEGNEKLERAKKKALEEGWVLNKIGTIYGDSKENIVRALQENPEFFCMALYGESPRQISLSMLSKLGWQPSKIIIREILEEMVEPIGTIEEKELHTLIDLAGGDWSLDFEYRYENGKVNRRLPRVRRDVMFGPIQYFQEIVFSGIKWNTKCIRGGVLEQKMFDTLVETIGHLENWTPQMNFRVKELEQEIVFLSEKINRLSNKINE